MLIFRVGGQREGGGEERKYEDRLTDLPQKLPNLTDKIKTWQ